MSPWVIVSDFGVSYRIFRACELVIWSPLLLLFVPLLLLLSPEVYSSRLASPRSNWTGCSVVVWSILDACKRFLTQDGVNSFYCSESNQAWHLKTHLKIGVKATPHLARMPNQHPSERDEWEKLLLTRPRHLLDSLTHDSNFLLCQSENEYLLNQNI